MRECLKNDITDFISRLENRFERRISRIVILPLFGTTHSFSSVDQALSFLKTHANAFAHEKFIRFEIQVSFLNGDAMNASFEMKDDAIAFLHEHLN